MVSRRTFDRICPRQEPDARSRHSADLSESWHAVAGSSIDWKPDAKYIVSTAENHEGVSNEIILVSADTGEVTPIDYEPEPDKRWSHVLIAVSPDGKRIACSRYKVGAADLAVIPFGGGTAKRLVAVSPSIKGLVWTPDGKELIWAEEAVNNPGLRRIAVDAPEGAFLNACPE